MASLGHVAVGLAAARWEASRARPLSRRPLASMAAYGALSLLPDADVLGFRFGVSYADEWGHRGASHSLAFALVIGLTVGVLAWRTGRPFARTFVLAALVVASHGLLDALTDGGLGAALAWPLSSARFFMPVTPLPVAPLGRHLISPYGLRVLAFEALAFLPLFLYALRPVREPSADPP